MIGMLTEFRKLQKNKQNHIYEFDDFMGGKGKFQINEISKDIDLLDYNQEYTPRELEGFKYYATKKIVEDNFPEFTMIAYG